MIIGNLVPDLGNSSSTDSGVELVASCQRNGSRASAHEDYCRQLALALGEAGRVLKDGGVLSLVYTHSSINGWAALVRAFRESPFIITSVQPLCIERKARPRAVSSNAVNTCLAFVARKMSGAREEGSLTNITQRLADICKGGFCKGLIDAGWSDDDTALAVFAQGVGLLANASLEKTPGEDPAVLYAMEAEVRKCFPNFKISKRKSL